MFPDLLFYTVQNSRCGLGTKHRWLEDREERADWPRISGPKKQHSNKLSGFPLPWIPRGGWGWKSTEVGKPCSNYRTRDRIAEQDGKLLDQWFSTSGL